MSLVLRVRLYIISIISIISISIISGSSVFALQQDKKENIYITADSTVYNYKTGVNIFEGHVKVDQGSTHIRADKLTTKNNDQHKIQEAIAYGIHEQAHYWTTTIIGQPDVHAKANVIKFYPIDSNIILEQHVFMTQADNSFRGQMVLYNMTTQTITVPASQNGRAVLVYHPDKL